nr:uncharacterized protein LOC126527926 [Dermacentor andersoni]
MEDSSYPLPQRPSQGLPMLGASRNHDFGHLPGQAWLHVLEYLDAESRLNVGDIGPNFKELAVDNVALLRTIRCDAHSDAASLRWLLELGRCAHVRRLYLNDCVVARPAELLQCIVMCTSLTELFCVRCPLDLEALFSTRCLLFLRRLEWTLRCDDRLQRCFEGAKAGRFSFALTAPLSDMYVEVESDEHPSYPFLEMVLRRCRKLRRLHVHAVKDTCGTSVQQCSTLAATDCTEWLHTFVFTTDADVTTMRRCTESVPQRALELQRNALVCGNVAIDCRDVVSSCVRLDDLSRSPRWLGTQKQVVLVTDVAAARKFAFVAAACAWQTVTALTLVSPILQAPDLPGAPRLCDGIATLLYACGNVTELNLNAFHFPESTSFSRFPGSLVRLRALSVAPCFLMGQRFCLESLASVCVRLDELDVRANYVAIGKDACVPCRDGAFSLRPPERRNPLPEKLIRLKRLTLSYTAQLNWFAFVNACDVAELRLCGRDFDLGRSSYAALSLLLAGNHRLFTLLVQGDGLRLDDDRLMRDVTKARNLRYLCLLSNVRLPFAVVERSGRELVRALPALMALHVQFRHVYTGELERFSWIRQGYGHRYEPRRYTTVANRSCALCTTSTFIGLAKPRC